jgi:hypothetical protein
VQILFIENDETRVQHNLSRCGDNDNCIPFLNVENRNFKDSIKLISAQLNETPPEFDIHMGSSLIFTSWCTELSSIKLYTKLKSEKSYSDFIIIIEIIKLLFFKICFEAL